MIFLFRLSADWTRSVGAIVFGRKWVSELVWLHKSRRWTKIEIEMKWRHECRRHWKRARTWRGRERREWEKWRWGNRSYRALLHFFPRFSPSWANIRYLCTVYCWVTTLPMLLCAVFSGRFEVANILSAKSTRKSSNEQCDQHKSCKFASEFLEQLLAFRSFRRLSTHVRCRGNFRHYFNRMRSILLHYVLLLLIVGRFCRYDSRNCNSESREQDWWRFFIFIMQFSFFLYFNLQISYNGSNL